MRHSGQRNLTLASLGAIACQPSPPPAEPAEPPFQHVADLVAGPVAFDPLGQRLVHAAGDPIRVLGFDGSLQTQWNLGTGVRDLQFAPDGSLWVLNGQGLVRAVDGTPVCTSSESSEAEQILGVSPSGEAVLGVLQGMETGVWGTSLTVAADCTLQRGELRQLPPTAIAWTEAGTWIGTSVNIGGGPTRFAPPSIGTPFGALTLFADQEATQRVTDLIIAENVLALSDTGAWELWTLDGSRRLAAGVGGQHAVRLPGQSVAAVGTSLVNLVDGSVTPDALPAPAVAISADGSLWVLGEDTQGLWRSQAR